MSKRTISLDRLQKQISVPSLRSLNLAEGDVVTISAIIAGKYTDNNGVEQPADSLLCSTSNAAYPDLKVPVREFMRMTAESGERYSEEQGSENVELPESFTVKAVTERKGQDGNAVYPASAYNRADEFFKSNSDMTYADLIGSGLKANHGLPSMKNYAIEID